MVLPEALVLATRRGDNFFGFDFPFKSCGGEAKFWREGGVNDVDGDGKERTLLLWAARGTSSKLGVFHERNVALASYLLERGADVNHSDHRGYTPLHCAAYGRSDSSPAMVALLLKAGANVLLTNDNGNNPLTIVLAELSVGGLSRPRMEIALMLLRALPSLDHACTIQETSAAHSSEWVMDWAKGKANCIDAGGNCIEALRAVVAGVRAAGGWRAYDRKPRAEVLRLRSLAQRGRAGFLPSTTRHYNYAYIRSLDFLVRCPPEIAWHVLGYWRCHFRVETRKICLLGVH